MKLEAYILETLRPYGDKTRAQHDGHYVGSSLTFLGLRVPVLRQVGADILCVLERDLTHAEIRKELTLLAIETTSYDVLSVCLLYFDSKTGHLSLADWKSLKRWSAVIDNWAHSDWLSSLYAHLVERFPKELYPTLLVWNASSNPWLRRLSLTSLLYYSTSRKQLLPRSKVFPLITARLGDDDPYVQKAVGWQLRECGNVWPKETKAFIKTHATVLSSTAFSYATEKWTATEKAPLKAQRKAARKKS